MFLLQLNDLAGGEIIIYYGLWGGLFLSGRAQFESVNRYFVTNEWCFSESKNRSSKSHCRVTALQSHIIVTCVHVWVELNKWMSVNKLIRFYWLFPLNWKWCKSTTGQMSYALCQKVPAGIESSLFIYYVQLDSEVFSHKKNLFMTVK